MSATDTTLDPMTATAWPEAPCFAASPAEGLRLATAPSTGRLRPAVRPGDAVCAGDVLAFVTGSRGRADAVLSPADGVVRALLVRPGQLVSTGRALVWVQA